MIAATPSAALLPRRLEVRAEESHEAGAEVGRELGMPAIGQDDQLCGRVGA